MELYAASWRCEPLASLEVWTHPKQSYAALLSVLGSLEQHPRVSAAVKTRTFRPWLASATSGFCGANEPLADETLRFRRGDGAPAGWSHIPPRSAGGARRAHPTPSPQQYERDTLPSAVLRVHARHHASTMIDLQLRRERVGLRLVLLHALDELRRDLAVPHTAHHVGLVNDLVFT